MKINLEELTIAKARIALDAKEFSVVDLASAYLEEIKKKNPELNVYLEVFDDVLDQAKTADERIAKGESHPLLGIPFAIKDNILIKGRKVSAASKILENYVAPYDATAISKLREQGAIFLGRVNMDEFALGGSTEKSAYGVTKNPHDTTRVPGGTSGGSAAAVAADMALASLGSDTGGSIRQPASFCGVVGLKPTYGAVSRSGLVSAVSSFDCIGPIAKTVEDSQIIFNVIKGIDILDSTSVSDSSYSQITNPISKIQDLTIGVPWQLINQDGVEKSVKDNFNDAIEKFKSLGFEIKDIDLPNIGLGLPVYYILNFAEVSSNLARFDGVKYGLHVSGKNMIDDYFQTRGTGFGPEVRRRILLGTYVLSSGYYDSYYGKAGIAREMLKKEFEKAFAEVDIVMTPTAPAPAWKIGEKSDPLSAYLADVFTVTANIVGIPAISLPSGFAEVDAPTLQSDILEVGGPTGSVGRKSLPLGIQLMAHHGGENTLFEAGKKFLGEN